MRRIVQEPRRVAVGSDSLRVVAKEAIVALAESPSGSIEFEPMLPWPRAHLAQRFPRGSVTTFMAVYERPFWRAAGLRGSGFGLGTEVTDVMAIEVLHPRSAVPMTWNEGDRLQLGDAGAGFSAGGRVVAGDDHDAFVGAAGGAASAASRGC